MHLLFIHYLVILYFINEAFILKGQPLVNAIRNICIYQVSDDLWATVPGLN